MHKGHMNADRNVSGSMITKAKEDLEQGGLRVLRFPKPLESAFNGYYNTNTLKHVRVALLTGLIISTIFGSVALMLLPADISHMWFIRYAVVCPMIMVTIIIGAFSNCLMENYLRRDFLNSLLLEHENRELQKASHEFHRLSNSDALTSLGNRRHFDSMLDQEWMRAMRSGTPISLILFDVDYFKLYNDYYGHQAGDECLKLVAEGIGGYARRPGDTSARYGGEEFVLLLSGTELTDAAAIAEACRACVESLKIPHGNSKVSDVVTVSAGVATMTPDGDTSRRALVEAADKALYRAKAEGRNRVVLGSITSVEKPIHLVYLDA